MIISVLVRGQHCGDMALVGYLTNVSGPVPLVLDLRVAHDRVDSSGDPVLNGHLRYPNNLDQSLNDTVAAKLRKYRDDYNFNPPRGVGFMSTIVSTSDRFHSEFIRILFLQAYRETDRFFAASGVISSQSDLGFFHYRRAAFSSMLKSRVGNILAKPIRTRAAFFSFCGRGHSVRTRQGKAGICGLTIRCPLHDGSQDWCGEGVGLWASL